MECMCARPLFILSFERFFSGVRAAEGGGWGGWGGVLVKAG